MTKRTISIDDNLYQYLTDVSLSESAVLRELRETTAERSDANMQIAPEQGQFMALLVRLMGARWTIEVGVYTGYSALCVAEALPPGSQVLACDTDEDATATARHYWGRAGVADRIDLRLAPALETLDAEVRAGHAGRYDFAFIDADKGGYIDYYERCLALLRPGGLIAVDNVLWGGRVDERVDLSLVPIADGLTLARKR